MERKEQEEPRVNGGMPQEVEALSKSKPPSPQHRTSRLTKSSSRKRKPKSLRYKYTLKRGCSYHQITKEDYPWLWSAFQRGAFSDLPIPRDINTDGFGEVLDNIIQVYYGRDGTIVVCEAFFSEWGRMAPIGVIFVDRSQDAFFPHVFWFSWATPRNKIESSINFLKDLVKDGNVLIFSERKTQFFFGHMARYGLLTRRGTLIKYFPDGGDAIIYQGRK